FFNYIFKNLLNLKSIELFKNIVHLLERSPVTRCYLAVAQLSFLPKKKHIGAYYTKHHFTHNYQF
uniref:Uncharacterized protein n=1 Tax=Megaselia scalaris TaxID=36166 RepID=T1H113_MEGSC